MRSLDRSRCPQCGEKVTPFAAGCAICGAALDVRRFDRPQRWRSSQNPWIARGALVAVIALVCSIAASRADRPSLGVPSAPAPTPSDAKRVVDMVVGGASPAAQREALKRYLAARGIPATSIATIMRHSRDGVGLIASKTATGTRIGGSALVPAGQDWPRSSAGYALDFIALIDFAQLPQLDPLPRAGRLALFYGNNPDDSQFLDPVASARAYYLPPGAPTASPDAPSDTYPIDAVHLRGRPMSFSGDSEQVVQDTARDPKQDRLIDAMNDVTTAELQPSHLLAEIDQEGDLTIADGGALYYAIPRRDLAAARFDRVAVIMQTH